MNDGGLERALALAEENGTLSIQRLAELIRIPSLTGEEGEAQNWMANLLQETNAEVSLQEPRLEALFHAYPDVAQYPTHWQHDLILPYQDRPTLRALRQSGLESVLNYADRPNLVAFFRGEGRGQSLILNGHVDTVTVEPSGAWTRPPFGAEIEDGLIHGRGASDMKGGLMAAIMAMIFISRAGVRLPGDVIFQSVVNEEHAGNGTLDLVRRGWRADAAIVMEPTNNRIAVGHAGGLYWQITIPGIPKSTGARWKEGRLCGVSAIEKIPVIVNALLDLERRSIEQGNTLSRSAGRSPFSLVIGKVQGGHYETLTASEVVLRGSIYFEPEAGDVPDIMNEVRKAIATANANDPFLRDNQSRLEFLHHDDATQQKHPVAIAATAGRILDACGAPSGMVSGPFACDMRHLVNKGHIPTIIFGTGNIDQAHKPDETIQIKEYLDSIGYLIQIIWIWCHQAKPPGSARAAGNTKER